MTTPPSLRAITTADDYDPNSMAVDQARAHIRAFLTPVTTVERLHIRDALGRILAEDVVSTIDVPAHDNSGMDGYAMRHADLQADADVTLRVVGTSFAGRPYTGPVNAGEAVRIFTGAVVPPDCDTVIMQERAKAADGNVTLGTGAKAGQNVRKAGEDLKTGAVVFHKGQRVRAAELGMLASIGVIEVSVYRRLRVALFSTGDELVQLGGTPGPGQIFDSNRYTMYGMLADLGCEVIDMGVVRDRPEDVEAAFAAAAAAADVVMTSGGVSVGDADYVKQMLDRLGEVLFWKIAMKPGRPLAFGRIDGAHFFGLAGQSGRGDGDLLPVRARRAVRADGTHRRDAGADVQGAARRPDPEGAGPHGIPARHPVARRRRGAVGRHDRRPGLGNPLVDEPRELLHRAAHRPGQRRRRNARRRAADGRRDLNQTLRRQGMRDEWWSMIAHRPASRR